jgi:hypothetical protein
MEASSSSSSSGYKAKLETSSAIALTWRLNFIEDEKR